MTSSVYNSLYLSDLKSSQGIYINGSKSSNLWTGLSWISNAGDVNGERAMLNKDT
ncbi:MAG: hypothetical protein N4A31_03595 [Rickettsiales bacterium]|jgi:hypothetical protein|nr:hypothetical protein [Rickettsiales bacterium]